MVVILKSMEQSSTFISYEPRHTPPSGDDYQIISRWTRQGAHQVHQAHEREHGAGA